jgi:hypothetical protein
MAWPKNRQRSGPRGYIERVCYQVIVIAGIAILLAVTNMLVNPHSPRYGSGELGEGEIRLADIPADQPTLWVDARSEADYNKRHVKGAILVNESLYYIQIANFLQVFNHSQIVAVYCTNEGCDEAKWVAERLRKETGAKQVYVVFGGWETIEKSDILMEGKAHQ